MPGPMDSKTYLYLQGLTQDQFEIIWNLIIPTAISNQERIINGANAIHCKYFLQKNYRDIL
jgi:hypothetical protein